MFLYIFFVGFLICDNAFAYLDPGSSSYILQILFVSLVGAGFWIKLSWRRVVQFFKDLKSRKKLDEKLDR